MDSSKHDRYGIYVPRKSAPDGSGDPSSRNSIHCLRAVKAMSKMAEEMVCLPSLRMR